MSSKDDQSVRYVYRNVNDTPLCCERGTSPCSETGMLWEVEAVLVKGCCIDTGASTAVASSYLYEGIVAYKGGDIERDWLSTINVFRIDIGSLGCPKTDDILRAMSNAGRLAKRCEPCSRRRPRARRDGKIEHCPSVETDALRSWLINRFFE